MSASRQVSRSKLAIYNGFLLLAAPVLALKKAVKWRRHGHAHEWDAARWHGFPVNETEKTRVVFVALSWGEVGILDEISRRLDGDDLEIIWSIRERAAQQMARERFPSRKIVPMPFDFAIPTQAWLGAVNPDVLVIVEKFWWPNLVHGAKLRGAQVILVNGRSRGRDRARYKLLSLFQRWVLSGFDLLLFESEAQIERVRAVLPRGVRVLATGNIKFSFAAPISSPGANALEIWLGALDAPLLIAGSTAPIDEDWALEAFARVRAEMPCYLMLAPRLIGRAGEIAAQIEARGGRVSRRSAPTNGAEIFILDTMGELALAYGFGDAAYVGGAVEGRGHNIIEPLAHGIPVAYGPLRGDFESVQRAAEALEVGFRLHSADDLAQFWRRALENPPWREEIALRAARLIAENSGALEEIVARLRAEIDASKSTPLIEVAKCHENS